MEDSGTKTFWLPKFFKISSFMFHRKKVKQVWNDMRTSK